MKRLLVLLLVLGVILLPSIPVLAATTADVTVTATPAYVAISVSPTSYDFSVVTESSTTNTTTSYFTIDNTSSVQTDQTISVTSTNWTGGDGWGHSDAGTAGASIAALKAQKAALGELV